MKLPKIAADIMIRDVRTCLTTDSLARARQLMREHRVRHLPVLKADTGDYAGVLTQKAMLREAFTIANKFGMDELDAQEAKRQVQSIMETDAETIQPQLPLLEAGRFFLACRHGCLPVLEKGRIVGILTSADFVKLSVRLLESAETASGS